MIVLLHDVNKKGMIVSLYGSCLALSSDVSTLLYDDKTKDKENLRKTGILG
jgi:hypothetical protein